MKEGNDEPGVNKEFTDECHTILSAVSDALYVIGGKWKLMIIIAMARGNNRFTELQKQVTGISARVLSSELKDLELWPVSFCTSAVSKIPEESHYNIRSASSVIDYKKKYLTTMENFIVVRLWHVCSKIVL